MAKKRCNPLNMQSAILSVLKNPDGSNRTSQEIAAGVIKINKDLEKQGVYGFTDAFKTYVKNQQTQITDDELTEFENEVNYIAQEVAKGKSFFDILKNERKARFLELLTKAKSTSNQARVSVERLKYVMELITEQPPEQTISAMELLENSLEAAKLRRDTAQVTKLEKALKEMKQANQMSSQLRLDWNAIEDNRNKKDRLLMEMAVLQALIEIGDKETAKQRASLESKITALGVKMQNRNKEFQQAEPEEDEISEMEAQDAFEQEMRELAAQANKLKIELSKIQSEQTKQNKDLMEKRLNELRFKIEKLDDSNADLYFAQAIVSTFGVKKEFIVSSLRDIKQRAIKVSDRIKFVKSIIENAKPDDKFTPAEVVRLFGRDVLMVPVINAMFHEEAKNEDGTPVKTDSNKPVSKRKEFITKEDLQKIFEIWSEVEEENIYDNQIDLEEAQKVQDIIIAGDRKLISNVDPDDPQPTYISTEEASQNKTGKAYTLTTEPGRNAFIADMRDVLGRLNTLSMSSKFNGALPEWALVAALGQDAQSLFTLFDSAIINPQDLNIGEVEYSQDPDVKKEVLARVLSSYGYSDAEIRQMPEFQNPNFHFDMKHLLTFKVGFDPKTNKIYGISIVVMDDNQKTVYKYSPKEGQYLNSEEINAVIDTIAEFQNKGFKVVGHNILGKNQDINALAVNSGNLQKLLTIGLRSYDTALLAFRGAPSSRFTRYHLPTLSNLAKAYYTQNFNPLEENLANLDPTSPVYLDHLTALAVTSGVVLQFMQAKANSVVSVLDGPIDNQKQQNVKLNQVVPLWFDNGQPGVDYHAGYKGMQLIFDIQPFQNMRDNLGYNSHIEGMYSLTQVQNTVLNLLLLAVEETNPNEIDRILTGLIQTPDLISKHYDLVLKLSEQDHEGYMVVKRELRKKNNDKYILDWTRDIRSSNLNANLTSSLSAYLDQTYNSFINTFKDYDRFAEREIQRFATTIGFREMKPDGETLREYVSELFIFSNKVFNKKEYTFEDYGNGNFDYIPARQLGRGFAQIILGFVREGNTLTQNIESTLGEVDRVKEEKDTQKELLDVESLEGEITKREYLPLKPTNVSFFSPLSRFEQERIYSDWALRKRYKAILNTDITDKERQAWKQFITTNKYREVHNAVREAKAELRTANKNLDKETDEAKKAELLKIRDEKKQNFDKARKEYDAYVELLDEMRLDQGRVQRYGLYNQASNKDIYTRIPTMDESIEMSLEAALNLPQYIATFVHDSQNFPLGDKRYLEKPSYLLDSELSAGGPSGRTLWPGISSLVAHYLANPQMLLMDGNKLNVSRELVTAALTDARKAVREQGMTYSGATYWDDKNSGIHHLVVMQRAYFPDGYNLLKKLIEIREGKPLGVGADQLIDYYNKTDTVFRDSLTKLREVVNDPSSKWESSNRQKDLEDIDAIEEILNASTTTRDFFKGVVIPVIYSGGKEGVIKQLHGKKNAKVNDPLNNLSNRQIEIIAQTLTQARIIVEGRLIDDILGMDANLVSELAGALMSDTEQLVTNYAVDITNILNNDTLLKNNIVSLEVLRKAIAARIEYVARLSIPPIEPRMIPGYQQLSEDQKALVVREETEKLVKERVKLITQKWQDRIDKAEALVNEHHKRNGVAGVKRGFQKGTELELEVMVALAGGEKQYTQQATLLFLTKVQAAGYKLNASEEHFLEAMVKLGRYISRDDVMFNDFIVFMSAAIGTGNARMTYPGNYLTNLQSSDLSKGFRLEYDKNGKIKWEDSIVNSLWQITKDHPYHGLSSEDARKKAEDLALKDYALRLATQYPPDFLGYDWRKEESRENWFRDWQNRSETERTFDLTQLARGKPKRQEFKQLYLSQQDYYNPDEPKVEMTDDEIDSYIQSNSVPFAKRQGIRIMALPRPTPGTIMTNNDAKGLGGFIPRIADHDILDAAVHGLYSIHIQSQRIQQKAGAIRLGITKAKQKGKTLQQIFDERKPGSSVYNPNQMPYIPVSSNSFAELLSDTDLPINAKINRMRFVLDQFAIEVGLEELSNTKQYARLYQIYNIHRKALRYARLLRYHIKDGVSLNELRMDHRNFVVDLFSLTKYQRDARQKETNLLDLGTMVSIDPTLFKDRNGKNMRWISALVQLSRLGVNATKPLKFGLSPTEYVAVDSPNTPDVLKKSYTMTKPLFVQGRDIAQLILTVLADDRIKRRATELAVEMGIKFTPDKQGFIDLSEISEAQDNMLMDRIWQDDELILSAVSNLNLYVTTDIITGENAYTWTNSKSASLPSTDPANPNNNYVGLRPGLGDPVVNRVKKGANLVTFLITAEGLKRMLVGARNAPLFERLETSLGTDKFIGNKTRLQALKEQRFGEFNRQFLQDIAEETEILEHLHGLDPNNKLKRLVIDGESELRDELGLTLNPYDAEYYFSDTGYTHSDNKQPSYNNLTPYGTAISTAIRVAIQRGKRYPTLDNMVKELEAFYTSGEPMVKTTSFLIFLRQNVNNLTKEQELVLVADAVGVDALSESDWTIINEQANKIMSYIDTINHARIKATNPYLANALKVLDGNPEHMSSNYHGVVRRIKTRNNTVNISTGTILGEHNTFEPVKEGDSKREMILIDQAVHEARSLLRSFDDGVIRYEHLNDQDIVESAYNPDAFEINFPGTQSANINAQLRQLVDNKVISEEVAMFYRLMIVKVMKHNPHLLQYFSITTEDVDSVYAGTAIKRSDKFQIKLNTTTLKLMGTADQVRVFAHEMAHIARLAFIKDNSPEWRKIEALVRSPKGRQSIETMMLAMNNGKKYLGFEKDLDYYSNNPEEFIASWGSWILIQKTFASHELLTFVQSRSQGALAVHNAWKKAFYNVQRDLASIAIGMNEVDVDILNNIVDITVNMFGFTSSVAREIEINNADQTLFNIIDLVDSNKVALGLDRIELQTLENLLAEQKVRPLTPTEIETLKSLEVKYSAISVKGMSIVEYNNLRGERESRQKPVTVDEPGVAFVPYRELTLKQKKEIAQTLVTEALRRTSKLSRSNLTFGGLSRTMANKLFGEDNVTRLLDSRSRLSTNILKAGLTKSLMTYESSDPIVASLMHIIGDTLSITQHQFQTSEGSKGIRENRNYTKQWIESVNYRTERLLMESSSREEFEALQKHAYYLAFGVIVPVPATITNLDAINRAQELAETLKANADNLRRFIFGSGERYMSALPVQLDRKKIGSSEVRSSKESKVIQAQNREKLIQAVAKQIKDNIINLKVLDPTTIYLTGILPRIQKEQTVDSNFIQELKRVEREYPEAFEVIRLATINHLVSLSINKAAAEKLVNDAFTNASFEVIGSGFTTSQSKNLVRDAMLVVVQNAYLFAKNTHSAPHTAKKLTGVQHDGLYNSLVKAMNSGRILNGLELFSKEEVSVLPDGVIVFQPTSSFNQKLSDNSDTDSLIREGTAEVVLASLVIGNLGEDVKFLPSRGILTGQDMVKNDEISPFLSFNSNVHLYEVERRQGFRAASKLAVFNATGIAGYDIVDILNLIESLAHELKTQDAIKLQTSLNIIREKLAVEVGLSNLDLSSSNPAISLFAKYGPDATRLAFGSNLNSASLMMEGVLGAYISSMYGGDPLRFVSTIFGSFFSTFVGHNLTQLEQRGVAVNLMLGIERSMQDSRETMHVSDTMFDRNATKLQKIRDWLRQNNNRGYQAVLNGLTQQAQLIIVKGIKDKSLYKVRDIFRSGKITNLTELKKAMKAAGLGGVFGNLHLQPHFMQELNKAGLFATEVLETYEWLLANINSTEVFDGTLDLQASLQFIETHNWFDLATSTQMGITFDKQQAYQTTKAIYNAVKAFREIVTVDPNPWDSATNNNAWSLLYNFYRQYPNLFLSQMLLRRGSQMEIKHYLPMLFALSVIDLIYNALLMVATGVIPLAALSPFSDEFIFKKDPAKMIKLIVSRNPIFGINANALGEVYRAASDTYNKTKLTRNTSDPKRIELMTKAGLETLEPDFVPIEAFQTTIRGPIAGSISLAQMWLLDNKVGGNLNDQESWEIKNMFIDSMGRMIPVVSELPFRILQQEILGPKPKPMSIRPPGVDPFGRAYGSQPQKEKQPTRQQPVQPTLTPEDYRKQYAPSLKTQATTPIRAPM